jgi:hypothetical protein
LALAVWWIRSGTVAGAPKQDEATSDADEKAASQEQGSCWCGWRGEMEHLGGHECRELRRAVVPWLWSEEGENLFLCLDVTLP